MEIETFFRISIFSEKLEVSTDIEDFEILEREQVRHVRSEFDCRKLEVDSEKLELFSIVDEIEFELSLPLF